MLLRQNQTKNQRTAIPEILRQPMASSLPTSPPPWSTGASPLLDRIDINDWSLIIRRFRGDTAVAVWLCQRFEKATLDALADPNAAASSDFQVRLIGELNRVIQSPVCIMSLDFPAKNLRAETEALVHQWETSKDSPEATPGVDLQELHRLLLEDAFPFALRRMPQRQPWLEHRPNQRKVGYGIPLRTTPWTEEELNALRACADSEADAMAARLYGAGTMPPGVPGIAYDHLVELVSKLMEHPELLFTPGSDFADCFKEYPLEFRDFFLPPQAPDWMDVRKMGTASALWFEYGLPMLAILCTASLPSCYLMKRGINVLYRTEKLRDSKYIFQRIYETALMLDRVMQPSGIELVVDHRDDDQNLFAMALSLVLGGEWTAKGGVYCRSGVQSTYVTAPVGDESRPGGEDMEAVMAQLNRAADYQRRRFIWGKGFCDARKVRFMHAAMRYVLNPPPAPGPSNSTANLQHFANRLPPWNPSFGLPINQEDMAFTLLTFSLVIPRGLDEIGCPISREQKEAFLHLWCVVGHLMGIRGDLLTDDLDQAQALYDAILQYEGGPTDQGRVLTGQVLRVLQEYLPPHLGLRDYLPCGLVRHFLKDRAMMVLPDEELKKATSLEGRMLIRCVLFGLAFAFWTYRISKKFPLTALIIPKLVFQATDIFIQTFRDEFVRRPFFVPPDAENLQWRQDNGVTPAFRKTLQDWRGRVFQAIFLNLILLLAVLPMLATALLIAVVRLIHHTWHGWNRFLPWVEHVYWLEIALFVASIALFLLALLDLAVRLPKLAANRPQLNQRGVSLS
jgi:hypothetical protein